MRAGGRGGGYLQRSQGLRRSFVIVLICTRAQQLSVATELGILVCEGSAACNRQSDSPSIFSSHDQVPDEKSV